MESSLYFADAIPRYPTGTVILRHGVSLLAEAQRVAKATQSKIRGWGSRSSGISSLRVGKSVVRSMDDWGVNTDDEYRHVAAMVGAMWKPSPAATASDLWKRHCTDNRCLPDVYRNVAKHGIFGGPTLCVDSRPAEYCTMIDRVSAYLAALDKPMPMAREFSFTTNERAAEALFMQRYNGDTSIAGFVDATVHVPETLPFGPLPKRRDGFVHYPVGLVRGIWPLDMLVQARRTWGRHGLLCLGWHQAAVTRTEATMRALFDRLSRMLERCKTAAKTLYTRVYGILCDGPLRTVVVTPRAVLWKSTPRIGSRMPTCRPDLAAAIAGDNHAATMGQAAQHVNDVMLMHVDALMLRGHWGYPDTASVGGWTVKDKGAGRALAAGVYCIGGECKVASVPGDKATDAFIEYDKAARPGTVLPWRADGRKARPDGTEYAPTLRGAPDGIPFGGEPHTLGGWRLKRDDE